MLDGTHYFECDCHSDEHTLRFTLDLEDRQIYASQFMNHWFPWYRRVWEAVRYVFGYKVQVRAFRLLDHGSE